LIVREMLELNIINHRNKVSDIENVRKTYHVRVEFSRTTRLEKERFVNKK